MASHVRQTCRSSPVPRDDLSDPFMHAELLGDVGRVGRPAHPSSGAAFGQAVLGQRPQSGLHRGHRDSCQSGHIHRAHWLIALAIERSNAHYSVTFYLG
jgi:hypothetical protein